MKILKIPKREEGQGLVEYALILVLVAIVVIIILSQMGALIVLAIATIIGSFTGQQLAGTGDEGIVVSNNEGEAFGGGNCRFSGDVSFVLTDDGDIITNETVDVEFQFGSASVERSVTIDGSGLGTISLTPLVSTCPADLVISDWDD